MRQLKILAPAKINVFLEVTGRRKDGYHNIESLMWTVGLYDRITISPRRCGIILACNRKDLPVDASNLALKAALLLKNELNVDFGAEIYLEKNIPVGAGLGGGSSDAAAVMKGLLILWKKKLQAKKLALLAKKLGADVPFFLKGGASVARGIGDKLKSLKKPRSVHILLVNPGFGVATKGVYNKLTFPLTKKQKINRILKLLAGNELPQVWGKFMFNRLEEAVLPDHPEIGRIKEVLRAHGFDSLMSGSGSTVFGIAPSAGSAGKLMPRLEKMGWKSWLVKTIA